MIRLLTIFSGLALTLFLLPSHSYGDNDQAAAADSSEKPAVHVAEKPQVTVEGPLHRAYAVRLRADGSLIGRTGLIDPNTLQLRPVPRVNVRFIQAGRVVTAVMSGGDGGFVVNGLTANAVYSVVAVSDLGFSAFSIVSLPMTPAQPAADEDASYDGVAPASGGETRADYYVVQLDGEEGAGENDNNVLQIPLIPAVDTGLLPELPPPGAAAAGAGGGGGGGGGDGGFLPPIVIPFGNDDNQASPFAP